MLGKETPMKINRKFFLEKLKEEELTQTGLSEITGISPMTFTRLIKHGGNCRKSTAVLIAEALDVELSELIEKEGEQ